MTTKQEFIDENKEGVHYFDVTKPCHICKGNVLAGQTILRKGMDIAHKKCCITEVPVIASVPAKSIEDPYKAVAANIANTPTKLTDRQKGNLNGALDNVISKVDWKPGLILKIKELEKLTKKSSNRVYEYMSVLTFIGAVEKVDGNKGCWKVVATKITKDGRTSCSAPNIQQQPSKQLTIPVPQVDQLAKFKELVRNWITAGNDLLSALA